MKYIDERVIKESKVGAKAGDFIYAGGDLRVIWETVEMGKPRYKAIYVTGEEPFMGAGDVENSLEELVKFYKEIYEDFELIKSEEMELIRRN